MATTGAGERHGWLGGLPTIPRERSGREMIAHPLYTLPPRVTLSEKYRAIVGKDRSLIGLVPAFTRPPVLLCGEFRARVTTRLDGSERLLSDSLMGDRSASELPRGERATGHLLYPLRATTPRPRASRFGGSGSDDWQPSHPRPPLRDF